MFLQRRLTLVFVFIVLLPLVVGAYVVQRVLRDESSERAARPLEGALSSAASVYSERAGAIEDRVRAAVASSQFARLLQQGDRKLVEGFLQQRIYTTDRINFLIALDRQGRFLGTGWEPPHFVPGSRAPTVQEILETDRNAPRFVRTAAIPVEIEGKGTIGQIVGGFWLDQGFLSAAAVSNVDLSLSHRGRIFASTAPLDGPLDLDASEEEPVDVRVAGEKMALAQSLFGAVKVIASGPPPVAKQIPGGALALLLLLWLASLFVTVLLAYLLARRLTQPLEQLSEGARAIAAGNLRYRIPVQSKDEVGRLAMAFNEMTEKLERTITQLSTSHDQLHKAIRRVGEALRSAHDVRMIFEAVLTTSAQAVAADAGVLWSFTPARDELYPAATFGLGDHAVGSMKVGEGIAGLVAERGRTVVVQENVGPQPASGEPRLPVAMAVPLYSDSHMRGVVVTYRLDAHRPFSQTDLETVIFLAEQAGVAIENVALHEEAQRLSLTDGLTHTYNRRYFQMQFRQVLATATRFERPFSLLMLDLDHFKDINDTYGHQRGDSTLIEFSQRVTKLLREVDTFARYGGEEFICLLSETDVQGAVITAEKIREAIRSAPFGSPDQPPVELTVSIGVATYPQHGVAYRNLVEAADQAMYRAKQTGRDRVCVAGEAPAHLRIAT
ncbi:MAG: diguanylate cyclase [Actinomycetota bacterium]|nr:diguanylate cyclase [Actinomycetota bacterium]